MSDKKVIVNVSLPTPIASFGITTSEVVEVLRLLGQSGMSAAEAGRRFNESIRNLGRVASKEVKHDCNKIKKKIIKLPKYRLIRDE